MLSEGQIKDAFALLSLPLDRALEGSPIHIDCPFQKKHTGKNRDKDTRLYFDTHPHVFCLHDHCAEDLRELNYLLRVAVLGTPNYPDSVSFCSASPDSKEIAEQVAKERGALIARFSKRARPLAELNISSAEFLSQMFLPDDVVWVGHEYDSGRPSSRIHFRTAARWGQSPPPPAWRFTTGCAFQPGSTGRTNLNIRVRRYLILESDELNLEETRAMLEWAEKIMGLRLVAIIFSGSRSLHGWFEFPGEEWMRAHKKSLEAAGFCNSTFRDSQPVRLGNATRENGKKQSILWLA